MLVNHVLHATWTHYCITIINYYRANGNHEMLVMCSKYITYYTEFFVDHEYTKKENEPGQRSNQISS